MEGVYASVKRGGSIAKPLAKVEALTCLTEPVMIRFVGGVIGFVVTSMYLPILQLYDEIR